MSVMEQQDMDQDRLSPGPSGQPSDQKSVKKQKKMRNASDDVLSQDKNKRGIIYLSYIPDGESVLCNESPLLLINSAPGLNPRNGRVLFSKFGEVDRIYFEPGKMRNGVPISYREGWIEFLKKRVAKEVASALHGSVISCRKKVSYNGSIWSIKYLHRVKWHHLSEQMNAEKVARDQRLRLEMGRVKKESDFFAEQTEQRKKRQKKGHDPDSDVLDKRKQFYEKKQNRGDDEAGPSQPVASDLLQRIFS